MNNRQLANRELNSGDVTDFRQAMRLYRQQMADENEITRQLAAEQKTPLTDQDRKSMKELATYGSHADEALDIYDRHIEQAKRCCIAELRRLSVRRRAFTFDNFADALESGDYSQLAI